MCSLTKSCGCDCASYPHLTLDRAAISKRIKQSKALKKRLSVVAEDATLAIALFRCPKCGEFWQSGREWNFGNEEYLFRVPSVGVEEWQRQHYRQPAAMMIYSSMMKAFYDRPFAASSDKCRIQECEEPASMVGVFCRGHQVEELQRLGQLPGAPQGKLFPPYVEEQKG